MRKTRFFLSFITFNLFLFQISYSFAIVSYAETYRQKFDRLSEILGSLQFINQLCDPKVSSPWRDQMQKLIKGQHATPERTSDIIAHFNFGYNGLKETYVSCTPVAERAEIMYLHEGKTLIDELFEKYTLN